jgi:hypothetical protein
LDPINAYHKKNWDRLARKKIVQQIVHGTECQNTTGPRGDEIVKIGRGVRQSCCLSPILFNLYCEYITKEALERFEDFKIGRQVIRTVKYSDDLVLLAREEKMLQGMADSLTEIGRRYGMEMNVIKN